MVLSVSEIRLVKEMSNNGMCCTITKIVLLDSRNDGHVMAVMFGQRIDCSNAMSTTSKFQLMEFKEEKEKSWLTSEVASSINCEKKIGHKLGPRGKIPQVGIQPWQLSIRSWSIRRVYFL
ncbi:hypothetical protein OUZ56_017584 [Daphnia magna]|uniref:Uncharacterized protein n=1 Tax=Daphnia magna TaxID=35525 RepID=A0ABR0AT69_9CRUS|nr:hypothetical protein OUZ56_017584 [Daphnia magna]